jgi:hypothetical protein
VPKPSRPAPEPLEGNDALITGVISAGWAVALVVLLILRDDLAPASRWWIWTCAVGLGLGLFGFFYVPRLKRARDRAARRRAGRRPQDVP